MTITSMELTNLRGLIKFASPLPWKWATSNSMARLSSASGKDGDVIYAYKAVDGVPCVNVSSDNMNLIASAVNYLPELLAHIGDQAEVVAGLKASLETSCQQNQKQAARIAELEALNNQRGMPDYEIYTNHKVFEDGTDLSVQNVRDGFSFGVTKIYTEPHPAQVAVQVDSINPDIGSKPFVVKLPGKWYIAMKSEDVLFYKAPDVIKAIKDAGGSVEDE